MSPKRRFFKRRRTPKSLSAALVAVAVAAIVAACAPGASHWSPQQNVKRNDVRWITFEHQVRFGPDGADLSPAEQARLRAFLGRHDAGYGDQLLVGAQGLRTTEIDARRAIRREAAVSAALRGEDLSARLLPDMPTREAWDGTVKIVLGRFVVVPPKCPDWSKRTDGDPANRVSSNFGCASTMNLGLMVVNPGDLVRGRNGGGADGGRGARLYQEYREGKQQQAPSITPLVIQSGVGGSGGGQ